MAAVSNLPVSPAYESLRDAVENMDALSQAGFCEIATLARLTLNSMETVTGCQDIDGIARVLQVIAGRADDAMNLINCAAEDVGCNHVDQAAMRRYDARRVDGGRNARVGRNLP